jgi:hypothetical protein
MDADNVNLLLYARYSTHQSFFLNPGRVREEVSYVRLRWSFF